MNEVVRNAAAHNWLQSLRLTEDFVTQGAKSEALLLQEEAALFDPLNLNGATLLEVGAANGYFSFAALRRGAARALATDHLAWSLPGADGEAATRFAAAALGLDVPTMVLDPRSLSADFGSFDIVVATACFEQLFNPVMALGGLRSVTGRVLLLETFHGALGEARPMMQATDVHQAYGGPGGSLVPGWAPNPPLVLHLLLELGFDRILYRDHPTLGAVRGIYAALLPQAPATAPEGFGEDWLNMTHPRG